ncbi:AMP-binding protein [Streptomyces rishiriensis]|uniref:AMP-binding protein n=1 Tax=Streptomyces rishiriensis TaxID=68264 RepID=UPI00131F2150|nr:AMP-binding protein [Streptomyces rishiriensis]
MERQKPFASSVPRTEWGDQPRDELVHARVAAHARRTPDAPALRWNGVDTSYGGLVEGARRGAAVLAGLGVGRGDVVVVRADCVPDTVRLLLGVMQCGAAYTIVPPDWPRGRYERIAGLDGVRLCVSAAAEDPVPGVRTIDLASVVAGPVSGAASGAEGAAASAAAGATGAASGGDDALCVFFTSGSSGAPKGVTASHRGLLRLAEDESCVVPGRMTTYQMASPAWDALAWELWVPLVRGGTCVLSGGERPTGARVRAAIAQGVDAIFLNTVLFNALVDDDIDCLSGLDLLLTGGERHSVRHLAACRRRHRGVRLLHAYGPSENTTFTTTHPLDAVDADAEVPIGRPVRGTDLWLLDEDRKPVPDGAVGEIVIGGEGLAIGYLGDPGETERRFPVLDLDGAPRRVYVTGDLGRWDEDGRLVFAGRRDRQIKLRGVRIEPAEIETVIEGVPGVRRAAVVALTDASGRTTGLAAVASSEGGPLPARELVTGAVTRELPAACVPERIAIVERLPKLSNGKVDHGALSALVPTRARAAAGRPAQPSGEEGESPEPAGGPDGGPDGELGPALAVAGELLGYEVGPHDDLFDHGATSMTAIRLATRLGRLLGHPVSELDILQTRTVSALLERLGEREPHAHGPAPAQRERAARAAQPGTGPDGGALFSLEKFWRMAEYEPDLHESIMPTLFVLRGALDTAALRAAVDAVVTRHDVLRARFRAGAGGLEAEILAPAEATGVLQVDRGAPAPRAVAERRARDWLTAPFPLRGAGPLRARLLRAAEGEWLLAVVGHHIAFDAWSTQLFWRELFDAYRAIGAGRPAFEGPAASFFTTYRTQLNDQAQRRPAALASWRSRAEGVDWIRFPDASDVPRYGPAAEVDLKLTKELMADAGRAAAAVDGTASAVFLAAFARVLGAHTGAADLAVCTPVSGRFAPDSAQSIGCYASMLALRLAAAAEPRELVRQAAGQLREAMSAPLLSIDLQLPEVPAGFPRHPLLQAYFVLEEVPPSRVDITADLYGEQIRVAPVTWVPELHLELRPHPDLGGLLRYRTDVVPRADAESLAAELVTQVAELSAVLG